MRQTLRPGHRPGERHGERKRDRVRAPTRARGERDRQRHDLQQHGQQKVRDAVAELFDQEDAAAGLLADAADGHRQQQDDRAEYNALEPVVKTGDQVLERHAPRQRHARGQQQRGAEGPVHVGRAAHEEGAGRNADQRAQRQKEFERAGRVPGRHVAALQFFGTERVGAFGVEPAGRAGAGDRGAELPAEEHRLFDAEQERTQHREDRVEAERHALEEEGDTVGLGRQKADAGHEDERLHVAGPRVERELRRDGRGGRIDDVGQFFVADAFLVGDGFDGRADEHGADGAALEEDHAQ